MTTTNIHYWEKVLENPTPTYKKLFDEERQYLTTHISRNSYIIDVGCGDGTTIQNILSISNKVIGVDNDPKAVADAQIKFSSALDIKIILADALFLPFAEKTFDTVIHMMTLVNFENNKIKALLEMSRVLKDDGKIILSVYSEDAFPSRLEMYQQIKVPIEKTEGTQVIFNESVGANKSEQFSKEELKSIFDEARLTISDCRKVESIAYICELIKK